MAPLLSLTAAVVEERRAPRRRVRLALAGVAALALVVTGALPALAGGGVVGDPQPELAKFTVGPTGGTGTGAILANNVVILASPSQSGTAIDVCVLHPASRACVHRVTLQAFKSSGNPQDTFSGPIEAFATGGPDVTIVAYDCCYIGANGVVVYNSTDGGVTWTGPTQAGDLGDIGAAAEVGNSLVVATSLYHAGTQVQAISPRPSTPQTSYAQVSGYAGNTAVSDYKGGALVAEDNLTNTRVEYAAAGSGLNTAASYKAVGAFNHEQVIALSGGALLTSVNGSLTGNVRLRFFNGKSFGPAHSVPQPKSPDDGYFAEEACGNSDQVFFIARRSGYDLMSESTFTGASWTALTAYSTAIRSSALAPVLNRSCNGVLFENDGHPLFAQPILHGIYVHVSTPATVHAGHTARLIGGANPCTTGAARVTLEKLVGGRWYPVKSVTMATCDIKFNLPGATDTYRVVVGWVPGWYQYGYSNAVTLTAVP